MGCIDISGVGLVDKIRDSFGTGGWGAARAGMRLLMGMRGFCTARFWPRPAIGSELAVDAERGIGGAALGFSKLPSWFCGKRGLKGGGVIEENAVNVAGPAPIGGLFAPTLLFVDS